MTNDDHIRRPFTATSIQADQLMAGRLEESDEEREERLDAELTTARRIARGGKRGANDDRTDSASTIQAIELARRYGGA
ncbi:hypothetical protein BFL35_07785 [Clavibacter michiganensis]|nr:hypothetical protein BFL35_07785 [Clavibacter michiganensis]